MQLRHYILTIRLQNSVKRPLHTCICRHELFLKNKYKYYYLAFKRRTIMLESEDALEKHWTDSNWRVGSVSMFLWIWCHLWKPGSWRILKNRHWSDATRFARPLIKTSAAYKYLQKKNRFCFLQNKKKMYEYKMCIPADLEKHRLLIN